MLKEYIPLIIEIATHIHQHRDKVEAKQSPQNSSSDWSYDGFDFVNTAHDKKVRVHVYEDSVVLDESLSSKKGEQFDVLNSIFYVALNANPKVILDTYEDDLVVTEEGKLKSGLSLPEFYAYLVNFLNFLLTPDQSSS